jgi:hypothetical protein
MVNLAAALLSEVKLVVVYMEEQETQELHDTI